MSDDVTRRGFLGAAGAAAVGAMAAPAVAGAADSPKEATIGIIAVSCSPHSGKNTSTALKACLDAAKAVDPEHIETELVELAGLRINGMVAANIELEPGERDDFPALVPKLIDPRVRGIIIGTPVYFSNMTSLCKAFLERCGEFRKKEGYLWRNKAAGVVAVGGTRNGGQELAAESVAAALFCQDMVVVGPGQPNSRFGALLWTGKEGVAEDETGMAAAADLGRRVAEVGIALSREP